MHIPRVDLARLVFCLCVVAGVAGIVGIYAPDLTAQTDAEQRWSDPDVISDATGHFINAPSMVSDPAGNVHVFWQYMPVQPKKDPSAEALSAIYYSRWNGESWSTPVDVLISPGGQPARDPAVALDPEGRLHVIWVGARVYYSWAPAASAGNPRAWAPVRMLAAHSYSADIIADAKGSLHVVYPARGKDVYYLRSDDGGQTWSLAVNVSRASRETATDWARLAVDKQGTLHAVWTQYPLPAAYPPAGVYYARSTDGGLTWSAPLELGGLHYGMANIAVDGQGAVHVVWEGDASTRGRYHRWSTDGGITWSEATDITGGRGIEGLVRPPAMAVDSAGILHLVFADNFDKELEKEGRAGTFYTYWTGREWAPLLDVAHEIRAWYGEGVALGVSEGNRLHIVVPAGFHLLWHTTRLTSAPHLVPQPLPQLMLTSSPTSAVQPESTPSPLVQPTGTSSPGDQAPANIEAGQLYDTSLPIAAGILPVVILLMAVALVRAFRSGREK